MRQWKGPSLKKNINFCSKFPSLFDISLIDPEQLCILSVWPYLEFYDSFWVKEEETPLSLTCWASPQVKMVSVNKRGNQFSVTFFNIKQFQLTSKKVSELLLVSCPHFSIRSSMQCHWIPPYLLLGSEELMIGLEIGYVKKVGRRLRELTLWTEEARRQVHATQDKPDKPFQGTLYVWNVKSV